MAMRKTIFYFFILLVYTSCGGHNKPDDPKENEVFTVQPVNTSACSELPAPRQFAYFSYFISDTAFTTLVNPAPHPVYRPISRGFIMYGGKNTVTGNVLNDLWLFDISNHETSQATTICPWVKLNASVMDEPRWGGRMIYRYTDNTLMLMGGYKHNSSKDESTSEILLMNLPQALASDTQRSFIPGGTLSPNFTRLKVYGDTANHNIETFSDATHQDDGVYESNLCNTLQPDNCLEPIDDLQTATVDEACMEISLPNSNSCGPSVTRCSALQPFSTFYEGCYFSASCTLGSTDNSIDKDPNGLARFALLYNPFSNGAITFGGTEGCQGSDPACSNWSRFDVTLNNPNPTVGHHELFSTAPFNSEKLSLMNSNNIISIDLASGNMSTDNIAYRQSGAVNDFIKDFWPEGATLGLSDVSGAITGLRWNIRNGGWEINTRPSGILVGGTFKQTIPPLYSLDINEVPCQYPNGCDQDGNGTVETDETFYESPTLSCYHSNWYGHYQLINHPDEDYRLRVAKIDLNNPDVLEFTDLINEVPPLINAEIVPFRFTSPNPRGGDDFIHDDYMLVGGSGANGQIISHPMLIGEDPRSGAAVTRIVPEIGPRESVVAVTDTLEQAVFVFGGSTDLTTQKISLKEHGLNRNKGTYHTTNAKITYKLDDNGTATDTDDEWTVEAKYNLRFNCEPSTLCFADKIALHLLDATTNSALNHARAYATLPGDAPCNLPAPQGAPNGLPEPDNYCHKLAVHTQQMNGIASLSYAYKTAEWNLPTPIADGDEIELVVQYKPDFSTPLDSKYENFTTIGAGKFLMGAGATESKGYVFNLAPVLVSNTLDRILKDYLDARDRFEKEDSFDLNTNFILPFNYMGITQGEPNVNFSEYNFSNRNEFRFYRVHILENTQHLKTISDPTLTPGMDGQSSIHIYGQTNVVGHTELYDQYVNCNTTAGEKYCFDHDLRRLQDTLGPYHHKTMHLIHMARHGNQSETRAITTNGVSGILSYDENGNILISNSQGPGYDYEESVINTHELCHNWFDSSVILDSWLSEGMCQYIGELTYYLDTDGDAQDDTQYNTHPQYSQEMNSLLHASLGTGSCGIHQNVIEHQPLETYLQGPYILNQFYFASRGNGLLPDNSYTGYWQAWRNFLHQHRKATVNSEGIKNFMDSLLPPYVTATGQARGGFYSDYVEHACRGIPLLALREFSYNIAPGLDPTVGASWYAPGSAGSYTVEQIQTTNFTPAGAMNMGYFSYVPYYLSCSQIDDPFSTFEQCYQIHVLKNDIETKPLTPSSFYHENQIAPMPTMADIVQADRLSAMTIIDFYNRYYCGGYNQSYTADDGSIVNCNIDNDSDSFKEPEDCGMVYPTSFDTNANINSITEENLSTIGDVDCNCYTYDGANLSYGCGEHKLLPDDTEVLDLLAGLDLTPPEDLCVDIDDRLTQGDISRNQYCSCHPPQDTCVETYCDESPHFIDFIVAGTNYTDMVSGFQDDAELHCTCKYENDVRANALQDCIDLLDSEILPEDDCLVQFPLDGSDESVENLCTCTSAGDEAHFNDCMAVYAGE